MSTHERRHEDYPPPTSGLPSTTPSGTRESMERLFSAGDQALARTRSADSATFNYAARQEPGQ